MALVIHCADIGSVRRGNFGWARLGADASDTTCTRGCDITVFADNVAADLNAGHRVALGFECPLFVPIPENPNDLTSARPGEGNRPWSAGAGAASLATGLTETVWILDHIRRRLSLPCPVHSKWEAFQVKGGLFIWEAFVTDKAKADTHHGDAELAVLCFRESLPNPEKQNAVLCDGPVRSLIGAALLQAGLVSDLGWLTEQCVVLRVRPASGTHT